MSNLTHCDGPGCDQTKGSDLERRLCTVPWIRVEPDGPSSALDFHTDACVIAYFSQEQSGTASQHDRPNNGNDAPCMCVGAQRDPHTKAEHRAYPTTTVDGR